MKFLFSVLVIVLLGTALGRPQDDDKAENGDLSEVVGSLPAGSPSLILDSEPVSSSTAAPTTSSSSRPLTLTLNNGASANEIETTQATRGFARVVEFARTIPSRFATLGARASTGFSRLREFRQGIQVNPDSLAYRTGKRISTTIQSLLRAARERADRFIARQNAIRNPTT